MSGPAGAQHFQHLIGRAGQTASDFLAHAHQTPFRAANPNFSHPAARPSKKKSPPLRSTVTHRLLDDEDLHDLVLDTRHTARPPISVRSHRDDHELNSARSNQSSLRATYSSLSEVRKRGLLLFDLRDHISTRASVPASLVPASQTLQSFRRTQGHPKPVIHNPTVMQFLNRFERKPVAKVAKMGRRGFVGQKLTRRSAKPNAAADAASSSDEADTYVEYFTLKSVA